MRRCETCFFILSGLPTSKKSATTYIFLYSLKRTWRERELIYHAGLIPLLVDLYQCILSLDHSQLQRSQKGLENSADPETQISPSWIARATLRAFSTLRIKTIWKETCQEHKLDNYTWRFSTLKTRKSSFVFSKFIRVLNTRIIYNPNGNWIEIKIKWRHIIVCGRLGEGRVRVVLKRTVVVDWSHIHLEISESVWQSISL